jgi:hypothetical protein
LDLLYKHAKEHANPLSIKSLHRWFFILQRNLSDFPEELDCPVSSGGWLDQVPENLFNDVSLVDVS